MRIGGGGAGGKGYKGIHGNGEILQKLKIEINKINEKEELKITQF